MAKLSIVAGTTSKLVDVFIQDSSSTTGAGLTGVVWNTAGLTAYYYREGAASAVSMTPSQTMTLGTWVSLGFIVIDGTNMPGCYQIGLPNAAIAAGAKSVLIMIRGVTNMAPCVLEIELTATDNQDAVHGGMTALPNTAVTTNASLLTSGTGTDQLSVTTGRTDLGKILGTAVSTPATAGILDVNIKNIVNQAAAIDANNLLKVDAEDWKGGVIPAVNVTGVPLVDLKYTLGTISPATAGAVRADAVTGGVGSVTAAVSVTGDLSATMKTSVTTACTAATPNVGGYQAGQDPATLVLDVAASGHNTAGTIGQKINAAGGAADPLTNPVPGSYGAGTAGNILGNFAPTMLKFDTSTISGEAANCILNYLRALRRVSIDDVSGVVTVYKEDGTVAWTAQATFDAGARPLNKVT
jgi:hypothetical protein